MKRLLLLVVALSATSVALARSVKTERVTSELEFSYEWPAKANAISGLRTYLQADMGKALRQARGDAADDARSARSNHYPFRQHSYSMSWDTEGETQRLISLEGTLEFDSNGAHPNSGTSALLWDREIDRQMTVAGLFAAAGSLEAVTRNAYCKALDAERLRRRQGERMNGEFGKCPAYKELAIVPVDRNRNRRFDHLLFVASPYVAGPYVEGSYEISLPVTAQLVAALKARYRASFEPQRQ